MIFTGVTIPSNSSRRMMDNPLEKSDGSLSFNHDDDRDDGNLDSNSNHSLSSTSSISKKPATSGSSNSAAYEMIPLAADFEPTNLDVICARGKEAYNHEGNIRFRQLVADQLHNYQSSTSKMAKSHIVREIIESVRRASPKGGFVKKVNGKWFDVGERARREKTGQQIRDLLHTQYKSSTKAKARTRKRLRKCHSANSATRVATQLAIRSAFGEIGSTAAGRGGATASRNMSLPGRIVTLDSETNSANVRAALADYRAGAGGGGFGGTGVGCDGDEEELQQHPSSSTSGMMKRSYRRQHSAPDLSSFGARITARSAASANNEQDYEDQGEGFGANVTGVSGGMMGQQGSDTIGDLNLNMIRNDRFSAGTFGTGSGFGGGGRSSSRLPRIRETASEPGLNNMNNLNRFGGGVHSLSTMNNNNMDGNNMNMGWGSASSNAMFGNNSAMRNHQGSFASSGGMMGASGLLQNAHQRQQLSDLSGLLQQQQQQQQPQPNLPMSNNHGFGGGPDPSPSMLMSSNFGGGGGSGMGGGMGGVGGGNSMMMQSLSSSRFGNDYDSFSSGRGGGMNTNAAAGMNPAASAGMQMMMGGGMMNNMNQAQGNSMMMMGNNFSSNAAAAAGFNGMGGAMGGMMGGMNSNAGSASGMGMGMGMMQSSSFPSSNNMNTRPQDAGFTDIFSQSGRMARPAPQPGNDNADPLFLPVEESIFESTKEAGRQQQQQHQQGPAGTGGGIISFNKQGMAGQSSRSMSAAFKGGMERQPQDYDDYSEESSEKSFEDALDNIHDIDDHHRQRGGRGSHV